jgi:hypothetical protein
MMHGRNSKKPARDPACEGANYSVTQAEDLGPPTSRSCWRYVGGCAEPAAESNIQIAPDERHGKS